MMNVPCRNPSFNLILVMLLFMQIQYRVLARVRTAPLMEIVVLMEGPVLTELRGRH